MRGVGEGIGTGGSIQKGLAGGASPGGPGPVAGTADGGDDPVRVTPTGRVGVGETHTVRRVCAGRVPVPLEGKQEPVGRGGGNLLPWNRGVSTERRIAVATDGSGGTGRFGSVGVTPT